VPGVRKLLLPGLLAVAGLLIGCGGGDDDPEVDAVDDGSTSSTTATTVTGGDGPGTTVTITPGGAPDPGATTPTVPTVDTTPIDPSTVETLPPAPDPGPTDPGFPPADPGHYAYTTTGMAQGAPVNRSDTFTVVSTGPSEIRYSTRDMVLDLQYRADGVYLRQLTAQLATFTIAFQSTDGALLIPIPPDAGRTWDWSMQDTTGGLTATWHGTTQAAETVADGAGPFPVVDGTVAISGQYDTKTILGVQPVEGTVAFRLWVDPALRLPRQLRQVTTITKPNFPGLGGDTTSTYTGFTPA
jgi:hypothetical protein